MDESYYKTTLKKLEDISKNYNLTNDEQTAVSDSLDAIKSLYEIKEYLNEMYDIYELEDKQGSYKTSSIEIMLGANGRLWKV